MRTDELIVSESRADQRGSGLNQLARAFTWGAHSCDAATLALCTEPWRSKTSDSFGPSSALGRTGRPRTRLAFGAAFAAGVGLAVVGASALPQSDQPLSGIASPEKPITPPPLLLRPVSSRAAAALNHAIPFSNDPIYPAQPFAPITEPETRARALECLATAVYYEAAGEPVQGQEAVAQVILNRVRNPAFASSVCGVVYEGSLLRTGCQFSFTCDGSLLRGRSEQAWELARRVADAALSGLVVNRVGLSTHYHSETVVPYWATSLAKHVQIGRHIFYGWKGKWGGPAGFKRRYGGVEADPMMLRATALMARGEWAGVKDLTAPTVIRVESNPKAELAGILGLIGSEESAEPSQLELEVRKHFAEWAAPVTGAQQLIGAEKVTSAIDAEPPAEPAAPIVQPGAPTRDLGRLERSGLFRAFLRAHRRDYKDATERLQATLNKAVLEWQAYTGTAVMPKTLGLTLTGGLPRNNCATASLPGTSLPAGSLAQYSGGYPALLGVGIVPDLLAQGRSANARGLRAVLASNDFQAELVFAVSARIAALSGGAAAERTVLRQASAAGYQFTPILVERLGFFERHRAQFPSLTQFLPLLVRGLDTRASRVSSAPLPGCADREAEDSQPAPVPAASALEVLHQSSAELRA